jgi:hypothetical protein
MHAFRSAAFALTLLAGALAGCGGCFTKTESHVDVPTKLEDVKKLHAPPGVTVSIERKEKTGGGASCGHSPVCLIILPVVAVQALFPDKWDEAKVVEGGKATYEGRFETNGALIEAVARKDDQARMIGVLPLGELGKRVIVEVARAPIGPDGKDGAFTRSAILPQVDLAADYRTKLAGENDADDRAELLVEYGAWLGAEALPLLEELLPKEPDESAAATVKELCRGRVENQQASVCDRVLAAVTPSAGPKTAAEGLAALSTRPPESAGAARMTPFAEALARHACEHPQPHVARDAADALESARSKEAWKEIEPAVRAKVAACPTASRQVLLELALRYEVSDTKLREALKDDAFDDSIVKRLNPDNASHRAAMVEAMPGKTGTEAYVDALARSKQVPSGSELEALAGSFLRDELLSDTMRRLHILELFARAKREPAAVAGARKVLEDAVAAAKEGDRPVLRAGLVVLGLREQAVSASRGLAGGDKEVIERALGLAGCQDAEIEQAASRAYAVKDADTGRLCTR